MREQQFPNHSAFMSCRDSKGTANRELILENMYYIQSLVRQHKFIRGNVKKKDIGSVAPFEFNSTLKSKIYPVCRDKKANEKLLNTIMHIPVTESVICPYCKGDLYLTIMPIALYNEKIYIGTSNQQLLGCEVCKVYFANNLIRNSIKGNVSPYNTEFFLLSEVKGKHLKDLVERMYTIDAQTSTSQEEISSEVSSELIYEVDDADCSETGICEDADLLDTDEEDTEDILSDFFSHRQSHLDAYSNHNKAIEQLFINKLDNVTLTFEQFSEVGVDKHQYLHYLWLFERLRDSFIFYEESCGFLKKIKRQDGGSALKDATIKILDIFSDDIMKYVENIIGNNYSRTINFRVYMQMFIYSRPYLENTSGYYPQGNSRQLEQYTTSENFKYIDEIEFRVLFENLIKLTIIGEGIKVIDPDDVEYDDLMKTDQADFVNTHNIDNILSCLDKPGEKHKYYKRICGEIEVLEKRSMNNISPACEPDNPDDPNFIVWAKQMKTFLAEEKEIEEELNALYEIKDKLLETDEVKLAEVEDEINLVNDTEHIIWVFKGQIGCYTNKHCIKSIKAFVKDLSNKTVIIYVDCCINCNKYYIDEEYLLRAQKKYGAILINLKPHESMGQYYGEYKRNPESLLMLHQYNVRQDGPSETKRHELLAALIDNNLMPLGEIIKYLMLFIKTNGSNYNNRFAKEKWQKDLDFVRQYKVDRTIRGKLKQI